MHSVHWANVLHPAACFGVASLVGADVVCGVYEAARGLDWETNNHVARLSHFFADPPERGFDPYGPMVVWPGMHPEYGR